MAEPNQEKKTWPRRPFTSRRMFVGQSDKFFSPLLNKFKGPALFSLTTFSFFGMFYMFHSFLTVDSGFHFLGLLFFLCFYPRWNVTALLTCREIHHFSAMLGIAWQVYLPFLFFINITIEWGMFRERKERMCWKKNIFLFLYAFAFSFQRLARRSHRQITRYVLRNT